MDCGRTPDAEIVRILASKQNFRQDELLWRVCFPDALFVEPIDTYDDIPTLLINKSVMQVSGRSNARNAHIDTPLS
jgi:hypothetical protein